MENFNLICENLIEEIDGLNSKLQGTLFADTDVEGLEFTQHEMVIALREAVAQIEIALFNEQGYRHSIAEAQGRR